MEKEILNTTSALDMLDGETELYKMLLDAFIKDCPSSLDSIAELISQDKKEEARQASHKIKGAASQIGAEQLTFALQYLEDALKGRMTGHIEALQKNADFVFGKTITYITDFRKSF